MVNIPSIMETFAHLMIGFANKKMRERSKFYARGSNFKELHKALGKEVLPEEYGGNAGPIKDQIGNSFILSPPMYKVEYEICSSKS